MKTTMCEKKTHWMETNSRLEGVKERRRNLKTAMETKKHAMRRKSRAEQSISSCETAVSGLIFVQRDPQRRGERGGVLLKYLKKYWLKNLQYLMKTITAHTLGSLT